MPGLSRVPFVPVSTGFVPTDIAGCRLWLDGADSGAVIMDGGYVDVWNDKSVNLFAFSPSAVQYEAPYLVFNGTSSYLQRTSSTIIDTNWSIFIVSKFTDTAYMPLMDFGIDGIRRIAVENGNLSVGATVDRAYPPGLVNTGKPFIAEYFRTSSSGQIVGAITGGSFATTIGPTGQVLNMDITTIGASSLNDSFFNGYIGEVLIYDSVLMDAQRKSVESYLAQKWSCVGGLPHGHPARYGYNEPIVAPIQLGSGFTPNDFDTVDKHCTLWLDGADTTNSIGLDSTDVVQWNDKSVYNDTDYSPAPYTPYPPTYQAPYVYFDGSTSLANTGQIVVDTDWSIFIVTKTTVTSGTLMDFGISDKFYLFNGGGYLGTGSPNLINQRIINDGNPFIAEFFRLSSTGVQVNGVNGGNFAATVGDSGQVPDVNNTNIGNTVILDLGFVGSIGEIIAYNFVLNDTQRQTVETYLAWKWGCVASLPIGHPGRLTTSIIYSIPFSTIVYDNLFFYLDATNPDSYSLGSSKMFNLISSFNDGWGAVFSGLPIGTSAFGGLIYFNPATFDYAETVTSLTENFFDNGSLIPLQKWSVEVWYYYNQTNVGDYTSIVTEGYNNTLQPPYDVQNFALDFPDGSADAFITTYTYNDYTGNGAGYTLPGVGWYHIVSTFDGRNLCIYVNNELVAISSSNPFKPGSSGLHTVLMAAYDFSGGYTGGYLSKVRVYNKALNYNEVNRNYSIEKVRFFNGGLNFGTSLNLDIQPSDPRYGSFSLYFVLIWGTIEGATAYIATSNYDTDLVVQDNPTSLIARVYCVDQLDIPRVVTVTATTPHGNVSENKTIQPCFLAGSLVQMADGSTKVIEDVKVNDEVVGAFGEINKVLFLHRPKLGDAPMCKINNEHNTTNHHPHISVDKKFYCGDPERVSTKTYGCYHKVINAKGNHQFMKLHGLKKERIQKLVTGVHLKTVEGSRVVNTLEVYSMPPETQLYNLVVGGSHTYYVEGYAVTGWPREDDFNYDAWTAV